MKGRCGWKSKRGEEALRLKPATSDDDIMVIQSRLALSHFGGSHQWDTDPQQPNNQLSQGALRGQAQTDKMHMPATVVPTVTFMPSGSWGFLHGPRRQHQKITARPEHSLTTEPQDAGMANVGSHPRKGWAPNATRYTNWAIQALCLKLDQSTNASRPPALRCPNFTLNWLIGLHSSNPSLVIQD